jgi:hypothetical protein
MLGEDKQSKELSKHVKRCATHLKPRKTRTTPPLALPSDLLQHSHAKNEDIAATLGLDSPLLYVPVDDGGRLARSHGKDLRYLRDITREGAVRVQKIAREGKVGGDRGLYTTSAVKQGGLVYVKS